MIKFAFWIALLALLCVIVPVVVWRDYVNEDYLLVAVDSFIAWMAFDFVIRKMRHHR